MRIFNQAAVGLAGLFISQSHVGAAVVNLGSAGTYAVLGASTVTNTGSSVITGDLGLSPGTSITGFPPGTVLGVIHANDAPASVAQSLALQAYNDLGGLTVTSNLTGQDLAQTLTSGVFNFDTSASLTGTLVLDGPGDFVFLIGTTLTTGSATMISLINGAEAANVFFRVGSSATLGTTSQFTGTILANSSISATNGAAVTGRLIALNGAVTLDNNTVAVPEISSIILVMMGGGLLFKRRRH